VDWIYHAQERNCSCEDVNEPSGSMKGREFLDKLSDSHLLKKDSAPWFYFYLLRAKTA
jgi:hypothetical protein